MSGACTATAVERTVLVCDLPGGLCRREQLPADAPPSGPYTCEDGDACSVGDGCAKGACSPGTFACTCKTDADCSDDGDLCNGKPFCDKSDPKKPVCKLNPATVVQCPAGGDTACIQAQCQPASGKCQPTVVAAGAPCDDGKACTKSEHCLGGVCTGGTDVCECQSNADCADKDDGNLCNGVLYCDKTEPTAPACKLNPATVVKCPTLAPACQAWSCNVANGQCLLGPAGDGTGCDDGDACTSGDGCQGGACKGKSLASGSGSACDDGDLCTLDGCVAGTCTHSKDLCEDANICTLDGCDGKTGLCSHNPAPQDGKVCDGDGSGCTVNDVCADAACVVGKALACPPVASAGACQAPTCASTGANSAQCVLAAKVDGAPCDDGDLCTLDGTCKAGQCALTGKPTLFEAAVGLPWAATQGLDVSADAVLPLGSAGTGGGGGLGAAAGGALLAGRYVGKVGSGAGWWWGVQGEGGAAGTRCVLPVPGGTVATRPALALPAGGDRWRLYGTLRNQAGDVGLGSVRVGADCQAEGLVLAGASDAVEVAAAMVGHGSGALAAGTRTSAGVQQGMAARLSAGGQLSWLWQGGGDNAQLWAITGRDDGGALAGGQRQVAGQPAGYTVRVDAAGKLVAEGQAPGVVTALAGHGGGVVAALQMAGATPRVSWAGVGDKGNVLWSHEGALGLRIAQLRPFGADLLAIGSSGQGSADSDLYVARVDGLGNIAWELGSAGGADGSGAAVAGVAGAGAAAAVWAVGSGSPGSLQTGLLLRADAFGHLDCKAAGACAGKGVDACDDGKACSLDGCDAGACGHKPTNGWRCPGDAASGGCSASGSCEAGTCKVDANGKLYRKEVTIPALAKIGGAALSAEGGLRVLSRTSGGALEIRTLDAFGGVTDTLALASKVEGAPAGLVPLAGGGGVIGLYDGEGAFHAVGFDPKGAQVFDQVLCTPNAKTAFKTPAEVVSSLISGCAGELFASANGTHALWIGTTFFAGVPCPGNTAQTIYRLCVLTRSVHLVTGAVSYANASSCESSSKVATCIPGEPTWPYLVAGGRASATADGGALLAGHGYQWESYQGDYSNVGHLERRTPTMARVFRTATLGTNGTSLVFDAAAEDGSTYLVAGRRIYSGLQYLYLARFTATGNHSWSQLTSAVDIMAIASVRPAPWGMAIHAQRTAAGAAQLWQAGFTSVGGLVWQRFHLLNGSATLRYALATEAGGTLSVGETAAAGALKLGVVRSDIWGHGTCGEAGGCAGKSPTDCDDGNAATLDVCDGKSGLCVSK